MPKRVLASLLAGVVCSAALAQPSKQLLIGTWDCTAGEPHLNRRVAFFSDGTSLSRLDRSDERRIFISGLYRTDGRYLLQDDFGVLRMRGKEVTGSWEIEQPVRDTSATSYRSWAFEIQALDRQALSLKLLSVSKGPKGQVQPPANSANDLRCRPHSGDNDLQQMRAAAPANAFAAPQQLDTIADRFDSRGAKLQSPNVEEPPRPKQIDVRQNLEAAQAAATAIERLEAAMRNYRRVQGCEPGLRILRGTHEGAVAGFRAAQREPMDSESRLMSFQHAQRSAELAVANLKGSNCLP